MVCGFQCEPLSEFHVNTFSATDRDLMSFLFSLNMLTVYSLIRMKKIKIRYHSFFEYLDAAICKSIGFWIIGSSCNVFRVNAHCIRVEAASMFLPGIYLNV